MNEAENRSDTPEGGQPTRVTPGVPPAVAPHTETVRGDPDETRRARNRQKPAFRQVLLVRRKNQTGSFAQELAQIIEVEDGHARPPQNRRRTFGAI